MIKKRILSMLVLLMAVVTGAWAKNYYNVTFSGFANGHMNTTVTTTLPQTFTKVGQYKLTPFNTVNLDYGDEFTGVVVTNDGNGMVSASKINWGAMSITVSGAFNGNATIQVGISCVNEEDSWDASADITVRCVFAYEAFDVTYDANGGSGAPSAQLKKKGTDLTLSTAVPTRTGYTFAGWNTKADGSGTSYSAGGSYTTNDDIVLYAQWTENTATLTDGDDLSALSAWAGKTCTVTYTRSFTAGKPSTVCLPFAYTKKLGNGSFYAFSGIEKNVETNEYTATMTEPGTTTLDANKPYLYMPSATGTVDFGGTYTIPDPLTAGETTTTSGDWTFKGTYSTIAWTSAPAEPTYGFSAQDANDGITQGQFVKVGSYVRIKPMRAYLEYNGSESEFAGARSLTRAAATTSDDTLPETIGVRLISANGEVNAIGTLYTRTGEVTLDGWYTLDGKRLSTQPTQKGIYVNNGKKVVIK